MPVSEYCRQFLDSSTLLLGRDQFGSLLWCRVGFETKVGHSGTRVFSQIGTGLGIGYLSYTIIYSIKV